MINFDTVCGPFNFLDFEGGVAQVIFNPFPSAANPSERTGQMLKFAGAEPRA